MKIDRQSLTDAVLSVLGGIIGGVAVGAFTVHRYLHGKPITGMPPQEGVPGEQ